MPTYEIIYLYNHKRIVPRADILIMNRFVLVIHDNFFKPFFCAQKMVLGNIDRSSINGGGIEDVRNGLVILGGGLVD
jgi:hypothetical protein